MANNELRYKKIAENKDKNTFEYRIKGGIYLNCIKKDWGVSRYLSLPLEVVKDLNRSIKQIAPDLLLDEAPQPLPTENNHYRITTRREMQEQSNAEKPKKQTKQSQSNRAAQKSKVTIFPLMIYCRAKKQSSKN